jgi:hypothetical protein
MRLQQAFPSRANAGTAKAKRDQYLQAIKKAKASYWDTFLQNAKGKEIFKALSYTKKRTIRAIPELQYQKQNRETRVVDQFKEQCTAFITTLFSSPPTTNTRLDWSNYQQGDWEWQGLDRVEVYNAIFTSSPKKAIGTDKLSFAILQKAY